MERLRGFISHIDCIQLHTIRMKEPLIPIHAEFYTLFLLLILMSQGQYKDGQRVPPKKNRKSQLAMIASKSHLSSSSGKLSLEDLDAASSRVLPVEEGEEKGKETSAEAATAAVGAEAADMSSFDYDDAYGSEYREEDWIGRSVFTFANGDQ